MKKKRKLKWWTKNLFTTNNSTYKEIQKQKFTPNSKMKDVSHTLSIIFLSEIKHSNQKAEIRRLDNTEFETKKKFY